MIDRLYIKNYLIIKEANIEFTPGLNILTGETGAGKSIIIDALSLILGERADYSIIRDEKEKLIVEGIFNFSNKELNNKKSRIFDNDLINFLKEKKIPNDNLDDNLDDSKSIIIIRRELYKRGISRNFINDYPVSINDLKELGKLLIDIHSQNEHQLLLDKNTHITQLDEYIKQEDKEFNDLYILYNNKYNEYKKDVSDLKILVNKRNEYIEKKEFIEFQLKEINSVNPQENEVEILEKELNKLENIEEINIVLNNCLNILVEKESNINNEIHFIIKELRKISSFDTKFEETINDFETVYSYIKELTTTLSNYRNDLQFEDNRIEEIRERLGQISFLKKKYRISVSELIKKAEQLKNELNIAVNYDFEIEQKEKKIKENRKNLASLAEEISNKRKKYAKKMENMIKEYFKEVGLENAELLIKFDYNEKDEDEYFNLTINNKNTITTKLNNTGIDKIEFYIRTNILPQQTKDKFNKNNNLEFNTFQPLKKIVSGGEISRIMLSIKAVLANRDKIPILVFDEIDAGVSGRIADRVGIILKELSKTHQIISITHLPQIAVYGDNNLRVTKIIEGNSNKKETIANIKKLNKEEKILEIARLLSSEKITDASIKAAKEMLSIAEKKSN